MAKAGNKPLRNIGVAITRPTDQAKKLTQLIEDAGGVAISFPLIKIIALNDYTQFKKTIASINDYDWIIFISSNAVQHCMPRLLNKKVVKQGIPKQLKFAAIGPTTAQALNAFNIKRVLIPDGHRFDSESLLSMPKMQDMQNKKVMIIRGIGGREVLANTLTERGAAVTFAECYQRSNPQTDCKILAQAHNNKQLHAIIITSSEAMRHLLDLAGDTKWLRQITLYVNHARITEQAMQMGLQVKIASAPGDAAMLKIIAANI